MIEAPLHWVKQLQQALVEAKAIPLLGFSPSFPWETFSEKISTLLHAPTLKISPRKTQFLAPEMIGSGLGANPIVIALELSPLTEQVFWLMGKEDVAKLTTLALLESGSKGFSSPKFQEGFYYYLATQVLATLGELQAFQDLSVKMGKFAALPQTEALCIDVEIHYPQASLWGRLICPLTFMEAFKAHFGVPRPPSLTSSLAQQIAISLHLEIGQTRLSLSQWKGVSVGDFIVLDRCSFDPKSRKGTVTLCLGNTPLLRARIKDSSIKIVDYATYHEEQNQMTNRKMPPENENSSEESFEGENPPFPEFESGDEEASLWASQNHQKERVEEMISTQEIPLVLTVEVAKMQMTLDKLLHLSPGNVLELPVKPEHGVDLTIGSKIVAKGELVKLGEMIGVKILQIGD